MTETITYKLGTFEGPLDLLLHLIAQNKLNIYDISISELLDQYMAKIREMQERMEVASEFLEMAARLVYIKTVSLLPRSPEAEQLRQELTGQLLEYQECKRVAAVLAAQLSFDRYVRAPMELVPDFMSEQNHIPPKRFRPSCARRWCRSQAVCSACCAPCAARRRIWTACLPPPGAGQSWSPFFWRCSS